MPAADRGRPVLQRLVDRPARAGRRAPARPLAVARRRRSRRAVRPAADRAGRHGRPGGSGCERPGRRPPPTTQPGCWTGWPTPDRAIARRPGWPGLTAAVVAALARRSDLDLPAGVRTLTGDGGGRRVGGRARPTLVGAGRGRRPVGARRPRPGRSPGSSTCRWSPRLGSRTGRGRPARPDGADDRWRRAAAAVGLDPDRLSRSPWPSPVARDLTGRDAAPVRWWGTDGRFCSDGSAASLGRVAAWAAGRWSLRHLAVAAAAQDESGLAESGVG